MGPECRSADLTIPVRTCGELPNLALEAVVERFGLDLVWLTPGASIPGSYWGEPEAGLIGAGLFVRADTPVHSALHETAHFVCMDQQRRAALNRDAGGDTDEECAVCLFQVVLAAELGSFGRDRCLDDMDRWGYTFREGSSRSWLNGDARDAQTWLERHGLVDESLRPVWQLRV
jgi:hypothetical protein